MKKRLMKTILLATALVLLGTGISFADGWRGRSHQPPGHAYGHYKFKGHPGDHHKNYGRHYKHPRAKWQHYKKHPCRPFYKPLHGKHPRRHIHRHHHYSERIQHSGSAFKLSVRDQDRAVKIVIKNGK
jgi:hypothetical protein